MATQNKDGFFRFATLRAFRALLSLRHFSFFANVIVSKISLQHFLYTYVKLKYGNYHSIKYVCPLLL